MIEKFTIQKKLNPLPATREWGDWEALTVDKFQCIQWKGYKYSVPEKYIGSELKTFITVKLIKIFDGENIIVSHKRHYTESEDAYILDHYLEQLYRKPTAIKFARVMNNEKFPQHILELRERLRNKYNIKNADLEFVKILFLKRQANSEDFNSSIQMGLSFGGITANAISSILKQLQLSPATTECNQEQLPGQCQLNIDHHFNLSQYDLLSKNKGSEYD